MTGFYIDEKMEGVYTLPYSVAGWEPMEFNATWGAKDILDSLHELVMYRKATFDLGGTVNIPGICGEVRMEGHLTLGYFNDNTITYDFTFPYRGEIYKFVGRKVNIKPWNILTSHTTCFGVISKLDRGGEKFIGYSITYFKLKTIWRFLKSFRLV